MKRTFIFLLSIFLTLSSLAQIPYQYIGVNNNRVIARGQFKADSALILPGVSVVNYKAPGMLRYDASDSSIYVYSGFNWIKVGSGSGGSSYSFTYPLQLNTGTVSLDTTLWHSFPFYNTQYRPITWVPTLQQVTTQGRRTADSIVFVANNENTQVGAIYQTSTGPDKRFLTYQTGSTLNSAYTQLTPSNLTWVTTGGNTLSITTSLSSPTDNRTIRLPDTSGVITIGAKVNGTTYMAGANGIVDIGTIGGVSTLQLTDSLNTNGVTGITLNTPNVIFGTPVTFSKTGRAWSGTLSLNNQSANTILAGPSSGSAATPTFRSLVAADIPDLSSSYVTTTTYNNAVLDSGWVDISNTSTIVGWSSFTDKILKYRRIGKTLYVKYGFTGTSNSTATSFTIPYTTVTASAGNTHYVLNNGTSSIGYPSINANSNVIEFLRYTSITAVTNSWTASGTKQVYGFVIIEIN